MDAAGLHRVGGGEAAAHAVVEKVRPLVESRSSNATSDGELTRVGTCGVENVGGPLVRPTSEILGKHAVDFDEDIADGFAPAGSRPVKVALVIDVECVRTKSSADSISNVPPTIGTGGGRHFSVRIPGVEEEGCFRRRRHCAKAAEQRQRNRQARVSLDIGFLPATRPCGPRINGLWVEMPVNKIYCRLGSGNSFTTQLVVVATLQSVLIPRPCQWVLIPRP